MLKNIVKGISSTDGRLNRGAFLLIFILSTIAFLGISFGGPMIFDPTSPQYSNYLFFLKMPFIAFVLIASINRFHDMNKSGWFVLLQLIPIVNIGITIWLLFGKGTKGGNNYGNDPLESV